MINPKSTSDMRSMGSSTRLEDTACPEDIGYLARRFGCGWLEPAGIAAIAAAPELPTRPHFSFAPVNTG